MYTGYRRGREEDYGKERERERGRERERERERGLWVVAWTASQKVVKNNGIHSFIYSNNTLRLQHTTRN